MKKIITVALVTVLCLATLASALVSLSFSKSSDDALLIDGLALTVGDKTFQTTEPNYFVELSNDIEAAGAILGEYNMTHQYFSLDGGYTKMTATTGDPYIHLTPPTCDSTQVKYIVITYRAEMNGGGEFYVSKSNGEQMSQSTMVSWNNYNGNGQWNQVVVDISSLCKSGVTFTNFRFDPWHSKNAGAYIDIKGIAGFATKADAENFNYNQYVSYLDAYYSGDDSTNSGSFETPKYVEKEYSVEDSYMGTLKYTENKNGTVTVVYKVNGETKRYVFENNPIYTSGGYAATDDVSRALPNASDVGIIGSNGEHYVGMFYFLWMGEHGDAGVYDLEKIRVKYGENAKYASYVDPQTRKNIYGPEGAMHWWGEPLYGYYYSSDEWVMRKHIELLTNAGVDFLYLDATNGYPYLTSAMKLMQIIHEYNEMGYNPPKVVFYTNTNTVSTIDKIYSNIYAKNVYPDTWFYVDGKPCIIGDSTQASGRTEEQKMATFKDYFTFKESQWPNESPANSVKDNAWPWMSFHWPQRVHKDANGNPSAISVSVAQHSGSVCFSDSSLYFTYQDECNRGRSYAGQAQMMTYRKRYDANPELSYYGYNYQMQWNRAIETDVPFILVTGWNEWVAQRQPGSNDRVVFIDTASIEFSRDAEMMRGGYFDNYYMQTIYNIMKLKGTAPIIVQDARNPINVTGDFSQWDNVAITYEDGSGDTVNRAGKGFGNQTYVDKSGRNDIVAAKVTNDTKNAYFYVQTASDIKKYDGNSSWMQLFVNADGDAKNGWYGYDYIINYDVKNDYTTTVAKCVSDDGSYKFKNIANVTYKVVGNQMMIEVPLEKLGIEDYRQVYLEFKWADADEGVKFDEMEDFYCFGDAAPAGRLNFIYQTYIPGESVFDPIVPEEGTTEETTTVITEVTTEIITEEVSEDVTEADTETDTEAPTETETEVSTETESETETEVATEPDTVTDADTEESTETDTEADTESDTVIDTETETETESVTETETETEIETVTETETETEAPTETESETESETQAEETSVETTEAETEVTDEVESTEAESSEVVTDEVTETADETTAEVTTEEITTVSDVSSEEGTSEVVETTTSADVIVETETVADTTAAETEATTEAATESEATTAADEKKGCKSTVSGICVIAVAITAFAVAKKKDEE